MYVLKYIKVKKIKAEFGGLLPVIQHLGGKGKRISSSKSTFSRNCEPIQNPEFSHA